MMGARRGDELVPRCLYQRLLENLSGFRLRTTLAPRTPRPLVQRRRHTAPHRRRGRRLAVEAPPGLRGRRDRGRQKLSRTERRAHQRRAAPPRRRALLLLRPVRQPHRTFREDQKLTANSFPMSYQVIARKWRPQTFEEVTGQEQITRTLRNAVEHERLHHVYLFSGPRGVGKTTTA